jgi:thiol-disulfide isomerase/thioredoxin
MRKTGILLLVCLAVPAPAQETAAPDSAAAWEKLDRQFKTAERKFYKPWNDAKANGEKYALDYTQHPNRTFMPRFVAFAKEHRGSEEAVKALIHVMRYTPDKEEEKTPHRDIKGFAMLARAKSLKGKDDARALRMLEKLQKNYFDVIERGTTLADRAEREIFEIVNLAVGKPAPEIEGEDLAGESFKLSDYRGKVVMLDFWGDW